MEKKSPHRKKNVNKSKSMTERTRDSHFTQNYFVKSNHICTHYTSYCVGKYCLPKLASMILNLFSNNKKKSVTKFDMPLAISDAS